MARKAPCRLAERLFGAAAGAGQGEALRLLLNATDVVVVDDRLRLLQNALCEAARGGHLQNVQTVLEAKADIDAPKSRDDRDRKALRAAASGCHDRVVRTLLKAGARIEDRRRLQSALQAAAQFGHLGTVQLLLEKKSSG